MLVLMNKLSLEKKCDQQRGEMSYNEQKNILINYFIIRFCYETLKVNDMSLTKEKLYQYI